MQVVMIPLDKIVLKYERVREGHGDITSLKTSLTTFGQLQPIILEDDMTLVAGFRRYSAAKELGWTEIAAMMKSQMDEIAHREIELEENIQRLDMTWQERAKAIAALHGLKVLKNPNWSQSMTAAEASLHQHDVSEALSVTKLMEQFPEVAGAKSLNKAMNVARAKVTQIARVREVKDNVIDYQNIEDKIILGDSTEVIRSIPDASFHAIITDPPFGVDYSERVAGTVGDANSYLDDKESYLHLLGMAPELYRVLKANGWLVWFCGITWYERAKNAFREAGFTVDEIPIIWDRREGRTFTNRPDRYFTRSYDIALHMFKGDPQLVQRGKPNIISVAPVTTADRELLVERPVELYAELIRRLTYPGEIVADFFVGSGSCPAAAAMLGRDYFGVELSAERRAVAIKKIFNHSPEVK